MNVLLKQIHPSSGNTLITILSSLFMSYTENKNVYIISQDYKKVMEYVMKTLPPETGLKNTESALAGMTDTNDSSFLEGYSYRIGDSKTFIIDTEKISLELYNKLANIQDDNAILMFDFAQQLDDDAKINCNIAIFDMNYNYDNEEFKKLNKDRTLIVANFFDDKVFKVIEVANKVKFDRKRVVSLPYNSYIRLFCKKNDVSKIIKEVLLHHWWTNELYNALFLISSFINRGE